MDQSQKDKKSVVLSNNPQLIFSWRAPLRAYKKRGKNILRFYIAVAFLLSTIVFFFGDQLLIVPIITVFFLFYVLTITPPPEVENKITVFGIETAGIALRWEFLSHFYFTKKFGFVVLNLVSQAPFFYHSYLIIPNQEVKNKVIKILSQYLAYIEKPQRSFTEKLVDRLSSLIPDDEEAPSSFPQKPVAASL
ncbi:MAG: hypothetical protein QHH09_00715 [Microgenomates group bacterium]|jgi:hypothetical protein|nr:hypothetical protein [Microgenomates group bacterium]